MDYQKISRKLEILADAAKYDVSCSSSGGSRGNDGQGLGNSSRAGICHSFTEDGRCVSLLKILLTNHCIYDCAYCASRRSNDIPRAAFTVDEVVDLTMSFYRRNYVEGLFLSSGIFKNADYTMERLVRIAKKLREEHRFNGYIHLKTIPKASAEILHEAGLYADRLSVNMEIPTVSGLKLLAPEKNHSDMTQPMAFVRNEIVSFADSRKTIKSTPKFAPAGQSTQFIIGAAGNRPSNHPRRWRVLPPLRSQTRVLLGLCTSIGRQTPAAFIDASAAAAGKPALSGRLADAFLRLFRS